jgi:very-short-patch-repair endonuclease
LIHTACAAPVRRICDAVGGEQHETSAPFPSAARHRSCALRGESGQLPVAEEPMSSPYHVRQSTQRQLELEARAHHLRHHQTSSESQLWSALRARRLGVPFRRQVVIGRYIADFVCREARLVVEVDGEVHLRRQHLDAHRDSVLQRAGYRILRIPAALITSNLQAAVALVRTALL